MQEHPHCASGRMSSAARTLLKIHTHTYKILHTISKGYFDCLDVWLDASRPEVNTWQWMSKPDTDHLLKKPQTPLCWTAKQCNACGGRTGYMLLLHSVHLWNSAMSDCISVDSGSYLFYGDDTRCCIVPSMPIHSCKIILRFSAWTFSTSF